MALRSTVVGVKEIIQTSLTDGQILAFMRDASLWVDESLAAVYPVETISERRLEMIERYLTCAFIRLRDLGLSQAKFDDTWEYYQVDPKVTDYLIHAARFDPTNTVRRWFIVVVTDKLPREAKGLVGRGFAGDD